jgi:hypothetical protein
MDDVDAAVGVLRRSAADATQVTTSIETCLRVLDAADGPQARKAVSVYLLTAGLAPLLAQALALHAEKDEVLTIHAQKLTQALCASDEMDDFMPLYPGGGGDPATPHTQFEAHDDRASRARPTSGPHIRGHGNFRPYKMDENNLTAMQRWVSEYCSGCVDLVAFDSPLPPFQPLHGQLRAAVEQHSRTAGRPAQQAHSAPAGTPARGDRASRRWCVRYRRRQTAKTTGQ